LGYPAALLALLALGAWTLRWRRADVWLLIGAAAIVARLWTYHFIYDDILIVLALIAVFRIATCEQASQSQRAAAGAVFGLAWAAAMLPARLVNLGWPVGTLYEFGQTAVWLTQLIFILLAVRFQPTTNSEASPA
jgi:hypothetical protein